MELPDVPLFRRLTADEAEAAVTALRMRRKAFAKGEILLEAGQRAPALGVVLAGRVHMEHLDVWGSKTLLGQAGPGDLFAETYALSAGRAAAGQRCGRRKRRSTVFGDRAAFAVRLRAMALEADAKSFAHCSA